ncbi:zinc metalloprotease [Bacillus sp. FJAT-27916]|uniref:site-2 protease family protein n=1 Tax=Bacillus sp. FJAT-27916 TaxID=1679169 RepID=UPI0006710788|nr:zinc metalloprotease [Bacillus sp. FJAT-27916]
MFVDFQNIITNLPYMLVTLAIAFTVHEYAHAYAAYKFGDQTAKNQGRLTLNPLVHIDPIGAIFLILFGFGWAKPVPVNRFFFKNPRLNGIIVSIVGPLSNLVLAFVAVLIVLFIQQFNLGMMIPYFIFKFISIFININVLLFVFNLLPFPPLDGYRIIEDLVNPDLRAKMTQYEQYGVLIFLILVITPLGNYTIDPILYNLVPSIRDALYSILY